MPGWACAQTADVVVLTETDDLREKLSIESALELYVDSSRQQPLSGIELQPFRSVGRTIPNVGYTGATAHPNPIWLRFRIHNATHQNAQLYARINFWCFDSLQFFVVDPARDSLLTASSVLGWRTPVEARPLADRNFSFPLSIPAGVERVAYLRVYKLRGTQVIPLTLWHRAGYLANMPGEYLFWGGVLLSLLFVAVMSLFFFITTRDHIYWSYTLCVLCLIGFFFINDGFMNQFAFDAQFWLPRQNIYFLFPLLLFYSQLVFIRTFLPLQRTPARWLHRFSTVGLLAGLACILMLTAELLVTYPPGLEVTFMRVFTLLYWLPMPLIGAFVVVSIGRRYYVAAGWLYLVSVSPFYLLNFGQVMANFGLIPTYRPLVDFRWYAVAALFEVLALTFGLAYRYKLMRDRNDELLSSQREKERTTYVSEVQSLALRNNMLEEKERIARDLHDNVGAQLALMITSLLHISRQAEQVPVTGGRMGESHSDERMPRLADELRAVVGYAREAIRTLRETIWAINQESFTIEEFGERLNQYVNRYVQQINGLEVTVQIDGEPNEPLSSVQVLNFFRIVQEALSNVVKHAQATHADVRLITRPDGAFHLTIHDNGRGLNETRDEIDDRHYGIHNMKRRAEELGSQFRIYDHNGTVVDVVRHGAEKG
ncbi:sensor histidine kinase [Fibrella forsythiae]|uniref:Histidine kinase n=1 Tax=Fibrella forsythiae TaxID=2817061 RepID=A0ABS3JKB7_9BACT|nr:7TM-DISM domain-containing protein [Fibrella forsythiae]MBO0950435.1 histidine kinase [Fibrella forsythiae]